MTIKQKVNRALLVILNVVMLALTSAIILGRVADSDAYFLIVNGRDIMQSGEVTQTLLHTVHEGFSTIIQQWIVSLVNFNLYEQFGISSLAVYSYIMYLVDLLLVDKFIRMCTKSMNLRLILCALAGLIITNFGVSRPTIVTISVLTLELILLTKYKQTENQKLLFLLPVLAVIEINMHAALWWLVPILTLPYLFPPLTAFIKLKKFVRHIKAQAGLFIAILVMFPATLINPNGLNGTLYLLKSYSAANSGLKIAELSAPSFMSLSSIGLWFAIAVIGIYLYKFKGIRDSDWPAAYLAAGTLFLGVMHVRDIWIAMLGIIPLAGALWNSTEDITGDYTHHETGNSSSWKLKLFSIVGIACMFFCFISDAAATEKTIADSSTAPTLAVEYLNNHNIDKNHTSVYTEFNSGAYMELCGFTAYIDARPELFQKIINGKADIYTEYSDLYQGKIDFSEFINKYNFKYFIVNDGNMLRVYLENNPDYKMVVDGNEYQMFVATSTYSKGVDDI